MIYITPHGFGMTLDTKFTTEDAATTFDNGKVKLTVVTSKLAVDIVNGINIDFVTDGTEIGFTIENPLLLPIDKEAFDAA